MAALAHAVAADGATPEHAAAIDAVCQHARRSFGQRHHLIDELGKLCGELTAGLAEVAEEDSWVPGQCESLDAALTDDRNNNRNGKGNGSGGSDTNKRHQ